MNVVEVLYQEYSEIIKFLEEAQQPSFYSDLNRYFKKILILSAASYFEHEIQNLLIQFISVSSKDNIKVIAFLKKKAINLQYHTFFNWGEKNEPDKPGKTANTFFSLFGDDFKLECEKEVKINDDLDKSIKAFLEIGHLRNILVHSNFAALNIDNKTTDEINDLFHRAIDFLYFLKSKLIWNNKLPGYILWKIKR